MNVHVTILSAKNLSPEKPDDVSPYVQLFSKGLIYYFVGETKSVKKNSNPIFNASFDIDFFKASLLIFKVFDHHFVGRDPLLGSYELDLNALMDRGVTHLDLPIHETPNEYPSVLTIEIDLQPLTPDSVNSLIKPNCPQVIPQIPQNLRRSGYRMYVYTSFDPPITDCTQNKPLPVEIKCLFIDSRYKYYTYLDSDCSWEILGHSTGTYTSRGPSGPTQIHRINPKKLSNTFLFFFMESSNYSGNVTINYIISPKDKKKVKDESYIYSYSKSESFLVHQEEIPLLPNSLRTVPYYISFDNKSQPTLTKCTTLSCTSFLKPKPDTPTKSDFINSILLIITEISHNISEYTYRQMMPLTQSMYFQHSIDNMILDKKPSSSPLIPFVDQIDQDQNNTPSNPKKENQELSNNEDDLIHLESISTSPPDQSSKPLTEKVEQNSSTISESANQSNETIPKISKKAVNDRISNIVLIVGGGYETMDKEQTVMYVHPVIFVFNDQTKEHVTVIEKHFTLSCEYQNQSFSSSNFKNQTKYIDQFAVHLDLDAIGKDKTIVIGIRIGTPSLSYVSLPTFVRIVDFNSKKELFFTPIKVKTENASMLVCKLVCDRSNQFEKWCLIPLFKATKNEKDMKVLVDFLNQSNWNESTDNLKVTEDDDFVLVSSL